MYLQVYYIPTCNNVLAGLPTHTQSRGATDNDQSCDLPCATGRMLRKQTGTSVCFFYHLCFLISVLLICSIIHACISYVQVDLHCHHIVNSFCTMMDYAKQLWYRLSFCKWMLHVYILVECYALMASGRGKAGYVCA